MAFVDSEPNQQAFPTAVKILVAGGFGVGKTTMVRAVSEIAPLSTEELFTEASLDVDDLAGVEEKTTTTVALDFGRITINSELILYLFGTPGQNRFWFMWDELSNGALGAVVIVDTRRMDSSFPSIDFFEHRGIPFVIAVNQFDNSHHYTSEELRTALDLDRHVPIVDCDARQRAGTKVVLSTLIETVLSAVTAGSVSG